MSNPDSFINEVTEEVRRDRLFALFRRWAWLAALIVVLIVGAAAFFEIRRTQAEASAEAFGDAVIAALDASDPEVRALALDEITPPGPEAEVLLALLAAGEVANDADGAEAGARLRAAAEAPDLPQRYAHLALLKAHLIAPEDPATARLVLGTLAEPGAPYAALAEEQLALLDISQGDVDAGIERLRRLEIAAGATPGLQQRAGQLIVALESGAELVDGPGVVDEEPAGAPALDFGTGGGELLPPTLPAAQQSEGSGEESEAPGAAEEAPEEGQSQTPDDGATETE